ncbi:MAG: hypothetical protein AAB565_02160, partial [Patescibacteria group bacterium]
KKSKLIFFGGPVLVIILATALYASVLKTKKIDVEEELATGLTPGTEAVEEEEQESPPEEAEAINLAAIGAIDAYRISADQISKANLANQLAARRTVLAKTIRLGNLPLVEKMLLSAEHLAAVPAELASEVEKSVVLSGELWTIHQDQGKEANGEIQLVRSKNKRQLIVGDQSYNVFLPQHLDSNEVSPNVSPRAKVDLTGIALRDDILAKPENISQTADLLPPALLPVTNGAAKPTKVALVLVNFSKRDEFITVAAAKEKIFGLDGEKNVHGWYRRHSFGQVSFLGHNSPEGDVFGFVTVPNPGNRCQLGKITLDVLAALASDPATRWPGIEKYRAAIFVLPSSGCPFLVGAASGMVAWVSGPVGFASTSLTAHEMGHIFGLGHASSASRAKAQGQWKVENEYGDPNDVMGNGRGAFHVYHQQKLGYSLPNNIKVVDKTGSFTLERAEKESAEVKYLRVPILAHQTLDGLFPGTPEVGLEYRGSSGAVIVRLETHPAVDTHGPVLVRTLKEGKVLDDIADSGLKITYLSRVNNKANVEVVVSQPTCIRDIPGIVASPVSQVGRKGK